MEGTGLASLLHIHASPKGPRSGSLRLANVFLEEARRLEPELAVTTIDLFHEELPEFGSDAAIAKFAPLFGEQRTEAQESAWDAVLARIAQLDAADRVLLSTPMWNFSIPYRLKHYFDLVMQPGVSFGYSPKKMLHIGLLRNRPVQLLLTRSSVVPGDFADFQLPWLKFAFEMIGMRDISVLAAWQTTQAGAEAREAYLASFEPQARAAAAAFLARPLPPPAESAKP